MMEKVEEKNNTLKLIPIYEKYMEYMIALILKLPRTEKFSIGTEFKTVMYETYRNIIYIQHIETKNRLFYLNKSIKIHNFLYPLPFLFNPSIKTMDLIAKKVY